MTLVEKREEGEDSRVGFRAVGFRVSAAPTTRRSWKRSDYHLFSATQRREEAA